MSRLYGIRLYYQDKPYNIRTFKKRNHRKEEKKKTGTEISLRRHDQFIAEVSVGL